MVTLGIVIPHFNQFYTLPASVMSLFLSKVHKQIVLVDDGSDLEMELTIDPYEITIAKIIPKHGVQFARNIGYYILRRFNCKYTLFSDSDVIWHKGALDKLVDALERSDADFAYCDYDRGSLGLWLAGEWSAKRLRASNYISTMSVIRTEALDFLGDYPFDEKIIRLQDWDLWLSLSSKGLRGTYVREILFRTEFMPDGISMKPGYQDAINVIREKHGL